MDYQLKKLIPQELIRQLHRLTLLLLEPYLTKSLLVELLKFLKMV